MKCSVLQLREWKYYFYNLDISGKMVNAKVPWDKKMQI